LPAHRNFAVEKFGLSKTLWEMAHRESPPETTIQSGAGPGPGCRRVLLVAGEGRFDTHPLVGGMLLVGRDPGCDVPLPHPKISRRHAYIHVGERIEVEDLGSTNGTRLAGQPLAPGTRTVLEPGKNLQLGPFVGVVLETTGDVSRDEPLRAAIEVTDPTPAGVPDVVARVATGTVSVLITGETGAGKEILARTIHELSGRKGELVAINCASLSETLLESELFGHERGSFTGAAAAKRGLFEMASGGTVFLDEIGELPAGLQAKLLRVLETRTVYRVGGVKPVSLDVRFVAATHRNLAREVEAGSFRRDLYFRVNGIALLVVPLRARREAIPALARELLAKVVGPGREPPRLTASALEALVGHAWPGNVRELRTVMERAAVICDGHEVRAAHILFDTLEDADGAPEPRRAAPPAAPAPPPAMGAAVAPPAARGEDDAERARILDALAQCAGNQTHAARLLGISRTTLVHKLEVHRIPRPRKPRP
jgi:DNA-binding NtrC family response regulator